MVPTDALCDEHLQREHHEIHQLVDVLRGKWNVTDYTAMMKVVGHASRGQIFVDEIETRHDELAGEMVSREIEHGDDIEYDEQFEISGAVTDALVEHNLSDLSRRCEKCEHRIENYIRRDD